MITSATKQIVEKYNKKMTEAKWEFLKTIQKLSDTRKLSLEEEAYVWSNLNPAHVTTKNFSKLEKYNAGISFKIAMSNSIVEKKFVKIFSIAPGINDKLADGKFIETLGYPIPKIIKEDASLHEVCGYVGHIIKSKNSAASKGVFLNDGDHFYHFFDKKNHNKASFIEYCNNNKLNSFIVEEYVGEKRREEKRREEKKSGT